MSENKYKKELDFIKTKYPGADETDKSGTINGNFWIGIAKLLNEYVASTPTRQVSDKIKELFGSNQPWSLVDVLKKLVESTNILLHEKGYDGHGWEEMEICHNRGNEIIALLNSKDGILDKLSLSNTREVESGEKQPKTVCFCGSTRFAQTFMIERWKLEKKGIITLGINILPDGYFEGENHHGAEQEGVKDILDELHKRKIDISDEVVILNIDGYIGESTRSELEYAQSIGKPIKYLEPLPNPPTKTQ